MSGAFYNVKFARTVLLLQLATGIAIGVLFAFYNVDWALSAWAGGLAAWLPNSIFMTFAWRHQAGKPVKGHVAWCFALGEGAKVLITFFFLIVALAVFGAVFKPLTLAWLSVVMVQIVAPIVINSKG